MSDKDEWSRRQANLERLHAERPNARGMMVVDAPDKGPAAIAAVGERLVKARRMRSIDCPGCQATKEIPRGVTFKEALMAIDDFRRAHVGCGKKERHDEQDQTGAL